MCSISPSTRIKKVKQAGCVFLLLSLFCEQKTQHRNDHICGLCKMLSFFLCVNQGLISSQRKTLWQIQNSFWNQSLSASPWTSKYKLRVPFRDIKLSLELSFVSELYFSYPNDILKRENKGPFPGNQNSFKSFVLLKCKIKGLKNTMQVTCRNDTWERML